MCKYLEFFNMSVLRIDLHIVRTVRANICAYKVYYMCKYLEFFNMSVLQIDLHVLRTVSIDFHHMSYVLVYVLVV